MGSNRLPGSGEWGLSSVRVTKLALVGLCGSVVLFVHAYQTGYPLGLTHEQGYISQVPLTFWTAIVLATISLVLVASSAGSVAVVPVLLCLFYLVFHSRQVLYYNLLMSDNGSISQWNSVLAQVHSLPTPGASEYFSYLQWPLHQILTMVVQRTAETGITDTIGVGLVLYLVLLAIGVFYFVYVYSVDTVPFFLFAGGSLYLVVAAYSLNNQFVPQFLAFILLVFLLPCHRKSGTRWVFIRLVLFIALVMAHPFIYIFYVAAFLLAPLFTAGKQAISEQTGGDEPVVSALISVGRKPGVLCLAWFRNLTREYGSSRWRTWAVTMLSVYVSFLVYRFVSFQLTVFYKISRSEPDASRTPFAVVSELIPGPIRDLLPFLQTGGTGSSATETVFLSEMVPGGIHWFTRNGAILVVVSVFCLLAFSQLLQRVDRVPSLNVSLASAGGLYFAVGGVLPLLANRALQVVFLPMVTAVGVLQKRPLVSRVVVAVLLVCSPVILANGLVNQSMTGGGNTEDYYTTRAGLQLVESATQQVVVSHQNSRPLKSRDEVTSIQGVMNGEYTPSSGDLVVSSPFVEQFVRHHSYRCTIDPDNHNVVYDNRASGLWIQRDGRTVDCTRAV